MCRPLLMGWCLLLPLTPSLSPPPSGPLWPGRARGWPEGGGEKEERVDALRPRIPLSMTSGSSSKVGATSCRQHLIQRDRQVAYALAGRMIDRVGDGRRYADDADLADALDAEGIDGAVGLVDEDHLDVLDVGVGGNVVLGDV